MSYSKQGKGNNRSLESNSITSESIQSKNLTITESASVNTLSVANSITIPGLADLTLDASTAARVTGTRLVASAASSATVTTTAVLADDIILVSKRDNGNAADDGLVVSSGNIVAGVSFDITTSAAVTDAGGVGVDWLIIHRL